MYCTAGMLDSFFNEAKNQYTIETLINAAEGLNLQVANILFNYEVPWSIVKLEQRMGRVWRLGQKREVKIYTLFLDNKSDYDALNIVYRKLLNLRNAEIGARPLLGQEVLTLEETDASEIGKVLMAIPEERGWENNDLRSN